jgi:hypothetical protein
MSRPLLPHLRSETTVEVLRRLRDADRRKLALILHWVSLVAAFGFLVWATRDQWFDSDEWNFLVRRRIVGSDSYLGIWDPHNRHWHTIPVVIYRVLFTLFGVRTYLPYLLLLFLLHLLVAHLLWRLMVGLRVDPVLATTAAAVFAFAGAGWENLANAFQIVFIGSLAAGLGALLVVRAGLLTPRRLLVWLLLLVSLMFSGVGVTMVAVVVVTVLLRSGLKAALVAGSVPTAAYLLWFLLQGRDAPPAAGEQPFWPALQATPAFLWRGLTSAVDAETGLAGAGAVVLILLAVWAIRHANPSDNAWTDATVLALGAVLFLGLTALGRSGLGTETAGASRYAYVTLALILPLTALAVDQLLGTTSARWVVVGLGFALLLLVSVSTVLRNADAAGVREQEQERRVLATAELVRDHDKFVESIPVPIYMPDLDVASIRRLANEGDLPTGIVVSEEDRLTARAFLQLEISDAHPRSNPVPSGAARLVDVVGAAASPDSGERGCVQVVPRSDDPTVVLRFDRPGSATLRSERSGNVVARLEDESGAATGRPRGFAVPSNRTQRVALSGGRLALHLDLPAFGTTTLCGLASV